MFGRLQVRSATASEWAGLNPTLAQGEIGHIQPDDPGEPYSLKIGDGETPWGDLPTITGGGGGGGAVESVNGKTGEVVLDAEDVGARPDDWSPDLSGYVDTVALEAGLDGKSDTGHGHVIADTTGLQTALNQKLSTTNVVSVGYGTTLPASAPNGSVFFLIEE